MAKHCFHGAAPISLILCKNLLKFLLPSCCILAAFLILAAFVSIVTCVVVQRNLLVYPFGGKPPQAHQPLLHTNQRTTNDQWPTTDNWQPTTDDQKPTTNDWRPAAEELKTTAKEHGGVDAQLTICSKCGKTQLPMAADQSVVPSVIVSITDCFFFISTAGSIIAHPNGAESIILSAWCTESIIL